MLKSFKVEMLVLSAIPSLVETWTCGFGFTVMDDAEKKNLRNINFMLFPGTILLKKKLWEASVEETGQDEELYSINCQSKIHEGLNEMSATGKGQHSTKKIEVELVAETHLQKEQGCHLVQDISMACCAKAIRPSCETRHAGLNYTAGSDVECVPCSHDMSARFPQPT